MGAGRGAAGTGNLLLAYPGNRLGHPPASREDLGLNFGFWEAPKMPFHPVTAALMYRGIYTVPNILAEQHPVEIPEDELEGERAGGAAGGAGGTEGAAPPGAAGRFGASGMRMDGEEEERRKESVGESRAAGEGGWGGEGHGRGGGVPAPVSPL